MNSYGAIYALFFREGIYNCDQKHEQYSGNPQSQVDVKLLTDQGIPTNIHKTYWIQLTASTPTGFQWNICQSNNRVGILVNIVLSLDSLGENPSLSRIEQILSEICDYHCDCDICGTACWTIRNKRSPVWAAEISQSPRLLIPRKLRGHPSKPAMLPNKRKKDAEK